MGTSRNVHDITLTATRTGNKVRISGIGDADLPKGTGAHRFNFTLTGAKELELNFSSLVVEDGGSTCPPKPEPGEKSKQIVTMKIGPQPRTAWFIDNNDNSGQMDISYQWNFTCTDTAVQVDPFDPIIRNGGGVP